MIRLFDFFISLVGILLFLPVFILISFLIVFDSGFPVLFLQERIGEKGKVFKLMKFRTMRKSANKNGLLTVGSKDIRITRIGFYLRKFKLDELPQLFNVLIGEMALVGPRPEVEKYVKLYSAEQKRVLNVKPGITDLASIEYMDESELLAKSTDPERTYIEEIMPHKIEINLKYAANKNLYTNIKVILKTILKIFS